jgi:hypothetical protein
MSSSAQIQSIRLIEQRFSVGINSKSSIKGCKVFSGSVRRIRESGCNLGAGWHGGWAWVLPGQKSPRV